jgi:hypothetical protein
MSKKIMKNKWMPLNKLIGVIKGAISFTLNKLIGVIKGAISFIYEATLSQ